MADQEDLFEQAARRKLRFDTVKGQISVEELWDLPLSSSRNGPDLDGIIIAVHHKMKNDNISFVNEEQSPDPVLQLRFDILRHVIKIRKDEKQRADAARATKERNQKILAIIADKEDAALASLPVDELRRLIAEGV